MAGRSRTSADAQRRLLTLPQLLGDQLRRLRMERGIGREAAGECLDGSVSKISRIEVGEVGIKDRDLDRLLDLYGVADWRERAAIQHIAAVSGSRQWWHQYGDVVADWFDCYLALEWTAEIIRTYELRFVPGLLQSPAYAREVIRLRYCDPAEVDRRLALRLHRQRMLFERERPVLWAIIDEAALRQQIGTRAVMDEQLAFLSEAAQRENVQIQILPIRAGLRTGAGNSFTMFRLKSSHLADVVYLEHLDNAEYLADTDRCDPYKRHLTEITVAALNPRETERALQEIAQGRDLTIPDRARHQIVSASR
ncbi:helix-turn-helix transcriptional regulator [Dactylosporangium sp. NPDC051485]|uniref:helix-turn-helix domain-containing protein n=1 Tax=Dactylosporangium sp. NPDC051485 TaxID=3154846 RepID=UPI0034180C3B